MFHSLPRKRKSSYQRPAWRSLLLILVLCGVAWAFWQNSQKQVDSLSGRLSVWDDSKVLTDDEKRALQDMISQFKSRYGINVRMEIMDIPLHAPVSDAPLVYIAINPKTNDVALDYPAWLRLEAEFAAQVKRAVMLPRMEEKQYAYALADALRAMWDELKKQEATDSAETPA